MLILSGYLLSYLKYGDHDAVLNCFTKERGFQGFFLRGAYSKNNKQKAYLKPLAELDLTISKKPATGSMVSASKIELIQSPEFAQNIKANSIIFFIADFLNQVLRQEHQHPGIYEEIQLFLGELENRNHQSHLIFLIRFLEICGVRPLNSPERFLDPETGTFGSANTHPIFSEELSTLWKSLINSDTPYEHPVVPALRKAFLDSIMIYYHYHFTDFRVPGSLEIVEQLF